MQQRKIVLSHNEKQMIETVRMFGPQVINSSQWRQWERIAQTGKVILSEPHGPKENLKTVSMPRDEI